MELGNTIPNIVTLGAHGRIQKHVCEYESIQADAQREFDGVEKTRIAVNRTLEGLVSAKAAGVAALKKLRRISDVLDARERHGTECAQDETGLCAILAKVDNTVAAGEIALNSVKGIGAGISTALGTWALVGTFGTASTGTAIGTLSGAAATNATLAWLGGGSIATGGFGMAGGAVVLGGLVVIPAVVIMGVFSHVAANKKINEIEQATAKALATIAQYKEISLKLDAIDRRAAEVTGSIRKATETFDEQFRVTYLAVFRFGPFSRAFRYVRRLLGGKYFSEGDLREISPLLQIAAGLAELIDVRLMDETGNLT